MSTHSKSKPLLVISQRDGFALPVSTIFISPIHIYEFAQFLLEPFTFMDTPLMACLDWGEREEKMSIVELTEN